MHKTYQPNNNFTHHKFPRNIFQVWFQGCGNMTRDDFITNSRNWKTFNPEWKYKCIDDVFLASACKEYSPRCYELYTKSPLMHMKIDLARYVVLYLHGGIYADMDAFILRPLNNSPQIQELISRYESTGNSVLGISSINLNAFERFFLTLSMQSVALNNAIMFSSPRNPVLGKFIDHVLDNIAVSIGRNSASSADKSYLQIQETTGPRVLNNFFTNILDKQHQETGDAKNIIVFAPDIFEPCNADNYCNINKNTISIHLFEKSWISPTMQTLATIYFWLKNNSFVITISIIFILIAYIIIYTKPKLYKTI